MNQYLLTQLRDWQAIKQAQALEHAGTPEGSSYLAESKRYAEASHEIERMRGSLLHVAGLLRPLITKRMGAEQIREGLQAILRTINEREIVK